MGHAGQLIVGEKVSLVGAFSGLKARKLWKSRRNATEGWFEDSSGRVKVMWFNQPYIASYVKEGVVVRITGVVGGKPENPYIANPVVEKEDILSVSEGLFKKDTQGTEDVTASGLFPVYPESKGITSRWFYHAVKRIFEENGHQHIPDPIPSEVCKRYNLPDLASALVWIHIPEKLPHTQTARKRFSFEEIFLMQVGRAVERAENDSSSAFVVSDGAEKTESFLASLPMRPTNAQHRAIHDVLTSLKERHPMARLLEGDVGSGKTLVAAATAYAVVTSRPPNKQSGTLQVAYMAPTEILAQQHFESFVKYFQHLPINIALMTGSGCKKFPSKISRNKPTTISKSQLLKWVAN
jgi:ATP-dependent DNA helicase RecG